MKSKEKISKLITTLDNFRAVNTKALEMKKAVEASGCEVFLDVGETKLSIPSNAIL